MNGLGECGADLAGEEVLGQNDAFFDEAGVLFRDPGFDIETRGDRLRSRGRREMREEGEEDGQRE